MSTKLFDITRQTLPITWLWYGWGLVAFGLTTWLTLQLPQLIQQALDHYVETSPDYAQIKSLALYMMLIGVGIVFIRTASRLLVLMCGRLVESHIRDQTFRRSLYFRRQSIELFKVGELISRLSTDARQVGFFYGFGIVQVINLIFTSFFALSYMLPVHTPLTIYVYIPIVLQVFCSRLMIPQLFRLSKAQQKTQAHLSETIAESFYHIHALHAEGCVDSFYHKIQQKNQDLQHANVKLSCFRETTMPYIGLISQLSYVIVLLYGGLLVFDGLMTVGEVAAFQSYVALQSVPLAGFGLFVAIRERARAAVDRFEELNRLNIEEPGSFLPSLSHPNKLKGSSQDPLLSLKHITFTYPGSSTEVLKDVNLTVYDGEHIGISGQIGSGKTTLFKLLLKLYDPTAGSYEFRGLNMNQVSVMDLREVVGFVTQDNEFFSKTIAENLCLGVDLDDEESSDLMACMKQATKTALIYDEIMGFEKGFGTQIGEKGMRLSGGQKTRLSLARALMRTKDIYLLDDIFAALDHGVEKRLIENLSALTSTFIFVSHRPSVLGFCHHCYELVHGQLKSVT